MSADKSHASAAAYIHTVQHLIEECILLNMSKQECMEALSRQAHIQPLITSTVWNELEKENREFFDGYMKSLKARASRGGGGAGEGGSGSDSSSQ
uniref:Angiotensin-converting enzyme 2 n=1 Tax=Kalanchoe fedtschenkoi TaxID=63787 RepID=A0A7N0RH43_KALFE